MSRFDCFHLEFLSFCFTAYRCICVLYGKRIIMHIFIFRPQLFASFATVCIIYTYTKSVQRTCITYNRHCSKHAVLSDDNSTYCSLTCSFSVFFFSCFTSFWLIYSSHCFISVATGYSSHTFLCTHTHTHITSSERDSTTSPEMRVNSRFALVSISFCLSFSLFGVRIIQRETT